jgi:Zn finger protein HypA/HybF involved in hydrogenase expression
MHDRLLFKNLLKYFQRVEKISNRRVKKIYVSLSEFGGITEEHFREHYKEMVGGTKWNSLDMEFKKIPYGPEFEITKIDFE